MSAWLVLVFLQFISVNRAKGCLRASNGNRALPNFVRPDDFTLRFRAQPIQAIITSYQFDCCGVITEWGTYVERSGGAYQIGAYSISFQVWRPNSPSPVDTDGCYTMIGVNHFMNIIFSDNPRGQITVSPSVSERIEVQPGDVIGFYLTSSRNDDDGIQFSDDESYNQESVWYATGTIATSGPPTCQFPVGPSGVLSISTNLAPLIRASVSLFDCPTTGSITMATIDSTNTSTPTSTLTTVIVSPSPTHPPGTETSITTNSQTNKTVVADSPVVGFSISVVMLVMVTASVFVVILTCLVMKRKSRPLQEGCASDQTEEGPYYSSMETQPSITKNEAYGKFTQVTSTDVDTYYYVNDPSNDPTIPTSQNAAYGDIPTSTNDDQDYYVYEGMNESMTTNKTYGKVPTANEHSEDSLHENEAYGDTANDSSIPTTENEAYNSVSANADGMEETYDYVRDL